MIVENDENEIEFIITISDKRNCDATQNPGDEEEGLFGFFTVLFKIYHFCTISIFVYFFQVFVQKMIKRTQKTMKRTTKYLIKPEKYFWIPV